MVDTEKLYFGVLMKVISNELKENFDIHYKAECLNNEIEFRMFYKRRKYKNLEEIYGVYYVDILTGNKYYSYNNNTLDSHEHAIGDVVVADLSPILSILPNLNFKISNKQAFNLAIQQTYNYINEQKLNFNDVRKNRPRLTRVFKPYQEIFI